MPYASSSGRYGGYEKELGVTATEFASRHDYVINTADPLFDSYCRSVVEAVIDVSLAVIARTDGLNVPTPKAPALLAASQPKRKHLTFDEIAEDILKMRCPPWDTRRKKAHGRPFASSAKLTAPSPRRISRG